MKEFVLVFPSQLLNNSNYFEGLNFEIDKFKNDILNPVNHSFISRDIAENDLNYKQIIPYGIIVNNNKILSYSRGKLTDEKRLLNNFSIGVGGHIKSDDNNLFYSTFDKALEREINEELIIKNYSIKLIALLNDDSNDVGKFHLGLVYQIKVDIDMIKPREKSINEVSFKSKEELLNNINYYESWSQICINLIDKIMK